MGAKKKKKKKAFKFNANHIDATTVTQTVHVDAPALSTDNDPAATENLPNPAEVVAADNNDSNDQWDDEKLASATARKTAVATASTAEKMRIEETKAQLAA